MKSRIIFLLAALMGFVLPSAASRLVKVGIIDKDYLVVRFYDGEVKFFDDGLGHGAFETINDPQNNIVIHYGLPLDLVDAVNTANWRIVSTDDPVYGTAGLNPVSCYRKSKPNGMAQLEWLENDFDYEATMEHTIYLKLPHSLSENKTYTLEINPNTNSHINSKSFVFDIFTSPSEAIHVNLVGYTERNDAKACDLYCWMGDGAGRDYRSFENNSVFLYNTTTKTSFPAGKVIFGQKRAREQEYYDQTATDVWNADASAIVPAGKYRIVIAGVGCSEEFSVSNNIYAEPFRVSTLGFFYMRIGQDSAHMSPVPRRPLYIPGKSPSNTQVIITTMQPYHPEWKTFSRGDVWDRPEDWARFAKPGRFNTVVYGGHSDALDWDRHLGHVSIIYDMLLPYFLTGGKLNQDDLGIAESGNGIPDILDEARNEVDFWLMLRDGKGYSHGITNPDRMNRLYQAENTAVAAWANAANSSMLSWCFKIAGQERMMETYRDSALNAYNYAMSLRDNMRDKIQNIGDVELTGMEFRLIADACLYNVTGQTKYEKDLYQNSTVKTPASTILGRHRNELWSSAAYLMTDRKVHYPELYANIRLSMINEAKMNETGYILKRPSRRATDEATGYFKTEQNVHRTMIAHAVADNAADRHLFEKALFLEADWGLGRNPLNMIQMTTATTALAGINSVENAYTSGRDDGTPGMHPGHTPYLNTDDWGSGMIMSRPSWMHKQCYPEYKTWPQSEGYFNTRWVWAHSEFTPQQTMRGKMALYGYLCGFSQ